MLWLLSYTPKTTLTGFAPATSTVTGWHSHYLSYRALLWLRPSEQAAELSALPLSYPATMAGVGFEPTTSPLMIGLLRVGPVRPDDRLGR